MAKAKQSAAPDNRRKPLLDMAAELFAKKGYSATSTRDIAKAVGMLPGSIYYHFKSKEEILLAVYHEGVSRFVVALDETLAAAPTDPWLRLEQACVTHVEVLLESGPYAQIIAPEFIRTFPPEIRNGLVAERDAYEKKFEKLIAALKLKEEVDPWLFKAALFGSLNWTLTWYHSGRYDATTIARNFLSYLSGVLQSD